MSESRAVRQAVSAMAQVEEDRLRLTAIPTGRFNDSFYVDVADGSPLVLRIAPSDDSGFLFYERGMMLGEPQTHRMVETHTSIPIPRIVATDFRRNTVNRNMLLMERMPGTPSAHWHKSVFFRMGSYLRTLHEVKAERHGYAGPHAPMQPQASWVEAFEIMWTKMIEDIRSCDGYNKEEARTFSDALERHRRVFDKDIRPSLLHMDIWQENVLINDTGEVSAVLDWDRSLWGDPEIEFAVLDYCGIASPDFWKGYGRVRDTGPDARVRAVFYLLYEVQKYIVIERLRRMNPVAADGYRRMATQFLRQIT